MDRYKTHEYDVVSVGTGFRGASNASRHPSMLLWISMVLFLGCGVERSAEPSLNVHGASNALPVLLSSSIPSDVRGEWVYSFPFFSSRLFIRTNGSFSLCDRGCTGEDCWEGSWSASGTAVVLSSTSRRSILGVPGSVADQGNPSVSVAGDQKGSDDLLGSAWEIVPSVIPADTMVPSHDQILLSLEGDTLFVVDGSGAKAGGKYIRTKGDQ